MRGFFIAKNQSLTYRYISRLFVCLLTVSLVFSPVLSYAQVGTSVPTLLPAPGTMIPLSVSYNPAIIKGITLYPDNPLKFDFIIDPGDDNLQGEILKVEANKLIKYFMASLTVPTDEMWVNLSPYEKDRIIANGLRKTELGRDLLVQDYILKQLTASLMYPEDELGSEFWQRVYAKAQERYGTTEVPMNTFNKVWIVPDKANVYVNENNIFIVDNYLKVMLEEDYMALENNIGRNNHGVGEIPKDQVKEISEVSKEVIREIIIPEIEREVNQGRNFAPLRQIFNSMILAAWYKQNLKASLLGQNYANQNKMNGINIDDPKMKERIYNQYVQAFEKGVYNYIKEDYDSQTQKMIPRKYFSGGIKGNLTNKIYKSTGSRIKLKLFKGLVGAIVFIIILGPTHLVEGTQTFANRPAIVEKAGVQREPISKSAIETLPMIEALTALIKSRGWEIQILTEREREAQGLPYLPYGGAIAIPNSAAVSQPGGNGGVIFYVGEIRSAGHLSHETTHVLQENISTTNLLQIYDSFLSALGNSEKTKEWLKDIISHYTGDYNQGMMENIDSIDGLTEEEKQLEKKAYAINEILALIFGIVVGMSEEDKPIATCALNPKLIKSLTEDLKRNPEAVDFLIQYYLKLGHDQEIIKKVFSHAFGQSASSPIDHARMSFHNIFSDKFDIFGQDIAIERRIPLMFVDPYEENSITKEDLYAVLYDEGNVGGIDLNSNNLDLSVQGDEIKIDFSTSSQLLNNVSVDGFVPIIINVAPITNIPSLLGESEEQTDEFSLSQLNNWEPYKY